MRIVEGLEGLYEYDEVNDVLVNLKTGGTTKPKFTNKGCEVFRVWKNGKRTDKSASKVRSGIDKRTCPQARSSNYDIVREMNAFGLTDSEIARRIGITQSCVSKLRRKLGLVSNHVRENPLYAPGNTVELTNGKAVIIGRTEGSKRRHDIKCCKCGHVFSRILNDADGIRCQNCHKEELGMNRLLKSKQLVLPMSFAKPVEYMDLDLECECQCCGKAFTERDWEKYRDTSKRRGRRHTTCSPECQKAFARHKRKGVVTIHWSKVAEHYKTDRCYLCGAKIDVNDYSKTDEGYFIAGPYYPSTDHVVAIANGGDGSMENSRLAHCICNSYKSDIPLRDFKGVQDVRIAC